MRLALIGADGQPVAERVELADEAFGVEYNEALVHQIVTAYMAGGRAGTRAQKNRSRVRGGGAKPWRQKGTGRSRAGTIRSPIWRGGGITFAARPTDHSQKVNRKMYRGAFRSIVSQLIRDERLVAVESFSVETAKTRELVAKLTAMNLTDVMIIVENQDEKLNLAARNLPWVGVLECRYVNPVSLLAFGKILVPVGALRRIEAHLA